MATNRYVGTGVFLNDEEGYKNIYKKRNKKNGILQYATAEFSYPSEEDEEDLSFVSHIWTVGDRYFKLADKYYGDSRLWWVIARYNKKPTESHLKLGDVLDIPLPLERILEFLRY